MVISRRVLVLTLATVVIASSIAVLAVTRREAPASFPEETKAGSPHALAQQEGRVALLATNAEDIAWIPEAFGRTYPGIAVDIYTDLNVASRVITEDRAGRSTIDVVWNSEALVQPLIERDLLIDDEWAKYGLHPSDVGAAGHMAITSSLAYAIAYRTDLVSTSDVPRSWSELAEVKYKGRMAASPILFARFCAALGAFEGAERWTGFARAVRRDSDTIWSNDLLEQLIVSGERPFVVATANYLAERWKQRGLPVEVVIPEPVFITQFGAVVTRAAPHPHAARLLASWLASPIGRAERERALLAVDLRPSSLHPKAVALRESGKKLYVDTAEAMIAKNLLIPEMDRIVSGLK
jgi:iron(III) transport system substrate-binding protein